MRKVRLWVLLLTVCAALPTFGQGGPWLFAGFKGDSADGVYFAVSTDGYHWKLVNDGKPVVKQTSPGELMRDPFVQRGPDGKFVMVWTWGWRDHTIGYSSSGDLLTWTPHRQLAVMANEPGALNVWAPAIYWDAAVKRWLILWSSTIPGRFAGDLTGDNGLNHRIFSTTTTDFQAFSPAAVYFDPGYSVIDATLLATPETKGAPFHLIFKDERKTPLQKFLQTAEGPTMMGPWTGFSAPISETWSEGAALIKVASGWLAYYDHYRSPQHYGAYFTTDFKKWADVEGKIDFPAGMRHGSFLVITPAEYGRLLRVP